ncbi:MAG: hypothetical protein L0H73_07525 [Nitrococcus sp.]|nr:hypothetical protein [Nitrococcus sp.]
MQYARGLRSQWGIYRAEFLRHVDDVYDMSSIARQAYATTDPAPSEQEEYLALGKARGAKSP